MPLFSPLQPFKTQPSKRLSRPYLRGILARVGIAAALLFSASLTAAQGITVAIGGGLQDDNLAVWSRLVSLAGGAGSRFTVFATASGDPQHTASRIAANLTRHGAVVVVAEVAPRWPGVDLAAAVADPRWIEAVGRSSGVFFSGGAQSRLLDTLQPGGQPTPLLQAVQAMWDAGGVVAGTSAGAAVMSQRVFRNAPDVLAVMKGRLREGREIDDGFGLLPPHVIVDQHAVRRGRIARLLPLLQAEGVPLGIGVAEDSAIIARASLVEVIGSRGALFIDIAQASTDTTLDAFNLRGARLHWLEAGDRFDLAAREVIPADSKQAASRLSPTHHRAPTAHPPAADADADPPRRVLFNDILQDGAIIEAMAQRLEGDGGDVLGLAFSDPQASNDPDPRLGFEWWLRASASSHGFRGADGLTLVDLVLDVVPVWPSQRPHAARAPDAGG